MFSDAFDVTSARLLKELHGQLVAEHRRQVAAFESSSRYRAINPTSPKSPTTPKKPEQPDPSEPSTPRTQPPTLSFHRGSTKSLDDLYIRSNAFDTDMGRRQSHASHEGELQDIDDDDGVPGKCLPFVHLTQTNCTSSQDSTSTDYGSGNRFPRSVFVSDDSTEIKILPCPLANLPHLESVEDDTPPHFLNQAPLGSNPSKSCLSLNKGDNNNHARISPRVSLVEAPCLNSVSERLQALNAFSGRRKSLSSMSLGKTPRRNSADCLDMAEYDSVASNMHGFEVLEVWTLQGGMNRKRIFSVRTKSKCEFSNNEIVIDVNGQDEGSRRPRMLSPNSPYHLLWDVFGLCMIVYECAMTPMEVFDMSDVFFLVFMAWLVRVYWTLNIAITFRTGFVHSNGAVELRPGAVSRRYCRTWLPLDLFCAAVDWAEAFLHDQRSALTLSRVFRVLRVLRTLRLLRLMKAPEMSTFVNERIRSEQVVLSGTILKIIFAMLGVAHLIACAWYAVGRYAEYGPGETTWIKTEGMQGLSVSQRYSRCLHWALSMVAGELIFIPENATERIFTICVLLFCILVSASFVSVFTATLTQIQTTAKEESSRLSTLRRYLFDQKISIQLKVRIQKNAQHALAEQKRNAPESTIILLTMISNPLLVELHFEIHSRVLMEHPFFRIYNEVNKPGVRKVCHIGVSMLSLSAGDVLFHDLEVPKLKQMFFVSSGGLDYKKENKETMTVTRPSWLCEAVLWTSWTHCGTARAISESRLMVLDAAMFQDCISSFPTEHARDYAEYFVELLNGVAATELTDLALGPEEQDMLIDRVFPEESDEESKEESSDEDEDGSQREGLPHESEASLAQTHTTTNSTTRQSRCSEDKVLGFRRQSKSSGISIGETVSHKSTMNSRVSKTSRKSSVSKKGYSSRNSSAHKKSQHTIATMRSRSQSNLGKSRHSQSPHNKSRITSIVFDTLDRVRVSAIGAKIFGSSTTSTHTRKDPMRISASTTLHHRHNSLQSSLPVGVMPSPSET